MCSRGRHQGFFALAMLRSCCQGVTAKVMINKRRICFYSPSLSKALSELRKLDEKLTTWREIRQNTILRLREIADYIGQTGFIKFHQKKANLISNLLSMNVDLTFRYNVPTDHYSQAGW